ncbi:MAG: fibrillarin-like rRNA/tRNA 2'-O-methyltransferase [Candidatus ainarchaeum sp.]|nr:fibrillarin-like rRNA/tRNA 2'-O-methyltransferase [Candidatus ainarchaeum sp.]MDD3975581.1 fibrillarin-like rRNA/tRNA 2'-O-methyltransferase [Candidatus ainarchaeum sp.]
MKNLIIKDKIYTLDLNTKEKREWSPFHSKVCAGIKKGIIPDIKEDYKILYLGAAEGYTISYISDLISIGEVVGIDISAYSMQKLILLSEKRKNLIPILGDCNLPENYKETIENEKFDLIIQDIAQKNQIEILKKNADLFLKKNGKVLLSLKLSAISQKHKSIINEQLNEFEKNFKIIKKTKLDPFEKKHILIYGENK